ncbi:hypothetical protein HPT25_26565 [Bacillus sp. BRMEA1]|nr:hypothetical protein [Neobacillus endophyticus]
MNNNKKGWLFLALAGCLALLTIFIFGKGYGYYNVHFDEYVYIVFNGNLIDKVTTTEEANSYAYLIMGLSIIPAFLAYFYFRKFLKLVPEVN